MLFAIWLFGFWYEPSAVTVLGWASTDTSHSEWVMSAWIDAEGIYWVRDMSTGEARRALQPPTGLTLTVE